jgi:hypothetical protein
MKKMSFFAQMAKIFGGGNGRTETWVVGCNNVKVSRNEGNQVPKLVGRRWEAVQGEQRRVLRISSLPVEGIYITDYLCVLFDSTIQGQSH